MPAIRDQVAKFDSERPLCDPMTISDNSRTPLGRIKEEDSIDLD
jgi:hypothetical protein